MEENVCIWRKRVREYIVMAIDRKILINQKSDWYLDELVAEMEQRTEKVDYSVYLFMLVDGC